MASSSASKDEGAMLTIGELSAQLGIATHILRYWETRFSDLKPVKRSGGRRYYRPDDVALIERINRLLNEQGYTVKGAQKALRGASQTEMDPSGTPKSEPATQPAPSDATDSTRRDPGFVEKLREMRGRLARALEDA